MFLLLLAFETIFQESSKFAFALLSFRFCFSFVDLSQLDRVHVLTFATALLFGVYSLTDLAAVYALIEPLSVLWA